MDVVQVGRGRLVAFRILGVAVGLLAAVTTLPFAIPTWFDHGKDSIHHIHMVSAAAFGLLTGIGMLWVAWQPLRTIGVFRAIVVFIAAGLVAGVVAGDPLGNGSLIGAVLIGALAVLHPARDQLLPLGSPDLKAVVVPVVALVTGAAYALGQARLQRDGLPTDPHVEAHHYSSMAWTMLGLPLASLAAAFGGIERRFVSAAVGLTYVAIGAASLRFPEFPSALANGWAWAAIAGGVAIAAAGELTSRAPA